MATYDYKAGKKRVVNILDNKLKIFEQPKVPDDTEFTFDNGYYSWVTGVFIDIRGSSSLFSDEDKEKVSKIIRCFTSENIEILRDDANLREIGIRGDCVYAIYTTPTKRDIYNLAIKTAYVNTYMRMLNKLLLNDGYPTISVGIGMASAQELVIKAGRKDVGINSKVWIGDAVAKASTLSSLGNKNGLKPIVYSSCSYSNFIDEFVERSGEISKQWFSEYYSKSYGTYYNAEIIMPDFNQWISDGMKD